MSNMQRTILRLAAIAVGMFGFAFALVPLYDVMCDALGIGRGTITEQAGYNAMPVSVDTSRKVQVQFIANNDGTMPWEFRPQQFDIAVNPGALNTTTFFARNSAPREMMAQAIPSISPREATPFFHKTECFCFTQQTLASGEQLDMPLRFIIDPALPANIHTITLSYTLFDVTASAPKQRVAAAN